MIIKQLAKKYEETQNRYLEAMREIESDISELKKEYEEISANIGMDSQIEYGYKIASEISKAQAEKSKLHKFSLGNIRNIISKKHKEKED